MIFKLMLVFIFIAFNGQAYAQNDNGQLECTKIAKEKKYLDADEYCSCVQEAEEKPEGQRTAWDFKKCAIRQDNKLSKYGMEIIPIDPMCDFAEGKREIKVGDFVQRYREYELEGDDYIKMNGVWIDGVRRSKSGLLWKVLEINDRGVTLELAKGEWETSGKVHKPGYTTRIFNSKLYNKNHKNAPNYEYGMKILKPCKK